MGDIYGAGLTLPYDERVQILKDAGIAVWDVVHACRRAGSMDADIKDEVPNDFESFYEKNPSIRRVVFDSLTAETIYKRKVLPALTKTLEYVRVPSPSPAHARLRYEEKLILWKKALLRGQ